MTRLVDALLADPGPSGRRLIDAATVATLSPLTVRFPGQTQPVRVAGSAAGLTVGQTTVVLRVGTQWAVAGGGGGGEPGPGLEFTWSDTSLGVRVEGESSYQFRDLRGPQGDPGAKGDKGPKGDPGGNSAGLSTVNLTGQVGGGTDLTIPTSDRGLFRRYTLTVTAAVGRQLAPFVVRVNNDGGTNYRTTARAESETGAVLASSAENGASFPRVGFLGEFLSLLIVEFTPLSLGDTGLVQWRTAGWANNGTSGSATVTAGGRWNGTTGPLTTLRVRTNLTSDEWTSGSWATLVGHAL